MKVYLLWFHEWEESYVLGVFETLEKAKSWREYFIENPPDQEYGCDMTHFAKDTHGYPDRFGIQENEVGQLTSGIKADNLKFLEFHEGKANEQKTKESAEVGEKLGFIRS
jgi:hypothetical protein